MKRGKVVKSKVISILNGKMMKGIEEGGYKYLETLVDGVRYEEIKGQIKKKYTKTVINILKPKLNRGDIILGTN